MYHRYRYAPASRDHVSHRIASLEKKPAKPGIPAIASVPISIVPKVVLIFPCRLPMFCMSCSPLMAWITGPEPRNSSALKNACVNTWNTPAPNAPTPNARNMYPSCETVEYASTRLMSFCTRPMVAAKIAVRAPTIATVFIAFGASTNNAFDRATMYTPAVTMVAAWIRAETGVGPSIASGSHTYNGNCADLPQAPTNNSKHAAVITGSPIENAPLRAISFTCVYCTEPKCQAIMNMPNRNPASPMRLTMNALLAAVEAECRWK